MRVSVELVLQLFQVSASDVMPFSFLRRTLNLFHVGFIGKQFPNFVYAKTPIMASS